MCISWTENSSLPVLEMGFFQAEETEKDGRDGRNSACTPLVQACVRLHFDVILPHLKASLLG